MIVERSWYQFRVCSELGANKQSLRNRHHDFSSLQISICHHASKRSGWARKHGWGHRHGCSLISAPPTHPTDSSQQPSTTKHSSTNQALIPGARQEAVSDKYHSTSEDELPHYCLGSIVQHGWAAEEHSCLQGFCIPQGRRSHLCQPRVRAESIRMEVIEQQTYHPLLSSVNLSSTIERAAASFLGFRGCLKSSTSPRRYRSICHSHRNYPQESSCKSHSLLWGAGTLFMHEILALMMSFWISVCPSLSPVSFEPDCSSPKAYRSPVSSSFMALPGGSNDIVKVMSDWRLAAVLLSSQSCHSTSLLMGCGWMKMKIIYHSSAASGQIALQPIS